MITIIEPHVDDAVQSCCELLFKNETIVVINFAGEERSPMSYFSLNRKVTGLRLELPQIHIWDAERFSLEQFLEKRVFDNVYLDDILELFCSYFDILIRIFYTSREIYVPLGIYHPHHIIVNYLLTRLPAIGNVPNFTYYYDQPYCLRNPEYIRDAENRLPYFEEYSKISVATPNINRKSIMLQCFDKKHLMGYEEQIHESTYLFR